MQKQTLKVGNFKKYYLKYIKKEQIFLNFQKFTVRNVRKFKKILCYIVNVKFNDIYDGFEKRYLEIAKNVLNFLKIFFNIMKLN